MTWRHWKGMELTNRAFVRPLNVEGELYIGIPPGVESRLACLTIDRDDLSHISQMSSSNHRTDLPSSFLPPDGIMEMVETLPALFNMLNTRRAIIPAANGHCSARALARYYAALVDGGQIPPVHNNNNNNNNNKLGSHAHIPKFTAAAANNATKNKKAKKGGKSKGGGVMYNMYQKIPTSFDGCHRVNIPSDDGSSSSGGSGGGSTTAPTQAADIGGGGGEQGIRKMFINGDRERLHDAFTGAGEYGGA